MNIKQFNEAFKRSYSKPNKNNSEKEKLYSHIMESVNRARNSSPSDYSTSSSYQRIIMESIENHNPGKCWWEVVDENIPQVLFEEVNIDRAVHRIVGLNESNPSYATEYDYKDYNIKFGNNGTATVTDKSGKVVKNNITDKEAEEWIDSVSTNKDKGIDKSLKEDIDDYAEYDSYITAYFGNNISHKILSIVNNIIENAYERYYNFGDLDAAITQSIDDIIGSSYNEYTDDRVELAAFYKIPTDRADEVDDFIFNDVKDIMSGMNESLKEDTEKVKKGKWVNKGKEGTHGTFKTKKEADAQRKAMFASGYKESLKESVDELDSSEYLDRIVHEYAMEPGDLLDILEYIRYILTDNGYDQWGIIRIQDYIDENM